MLSSTIPLRTVAIVILLAVMASIGIASTSGPTRAPAKHKIEKQARRKELVAKTRDAGASPTQPTGPPGNWTTIFDSEFTGTSLNTDQWVDHAGYVDQNNVADRASNVSVQNGDLILTLSDARSGAAIESAHATLNVGDYVQASIDFSGGGSTIYNWPAFWTAGPGWPASGEQDIFEGQEGAATVNYHGQVNGSEVQVGPLSVPGNWSNGFHTYGVYRGANFAEVYWDGRLVGSYPTNDDGGPEYLILTMGANRPMAFAARSRMLVSYVREWRRNWPIGSSGPDDRCGGNGLGWLPHDPELGGQGRIEIRPVPTGQYVLRTLDACG